MRKVIKFLGFMALMLLFSGVILPALARLDCLKVVRNNIEKGLDAGAYFYTEIADQNVFKLPDE